MNPRYSEIARRANYRCEYCLAPQALFNCPFEVEHIIPISQQGLSEPSNLALACRSCNLHKSAHVVAHDSETSQDVAIFDPRRQSWGNHFTWDLDRGEILGLTAVGRATVQLLRMNDPIALCARLLWIQLKLFP